MAQLINQSKNKTIFKTVETATSFKTRLIGLIGTKRLPKEKAIYFPQCNWIHTFFMSMPIDVIYLDKAMRVTKIQTQLSPWRIPAPVFSARSVIESAAGILNQDIIEVGDLLYVGN